MRRGEVRWYKFDYPDKQRPVLILTRDSAIGLLTTVTVAPITRTVRDIPSEVFLSEEDGLLTACAANLDNIQTVAQAKMGDRLTRLSAIRMEEVERALLFALGFDRFVGLVEAY